MFFCLFFAVKQQPNGKIHLLLVIDYGIDEVPVN